MPIHTPLSAGILDNKYEFMGYLMCNPACMPAAAVQIGHVCTPSEWQHAHPASSGNEHRKLVGTCAPVPCPLHVASRRPAAHLAMGGSMACWALATNIGEHDEVRITVREHAFDADVSRVCAV